MIVMEILDAAWQTVYDFAHCSGRWSDETARSTMYRRLNDSLAKLRGNGFVHGDFHTNGIMVKEGRGGERSAVAFDFDWAGSGKVRCTTPSIVTRSPPA